MPLKNKPSGKPAEYLLAVDAGVRTGLALFGNDGKLVWYRSHNMGSPASLKKAIYPLLKSIDCLVYLFVEGGGPITESWMNASAKLGITAYKTDAGVWRKDLLYESEFPNGQKAKENAIKLAEAEIKKSGAPSYNKPGHDAAEAILMGIWACKKVNWIEKIELNH